VKHCRKFAHLLGYVPDVTQIQSAMATISIRSLDDEVVRGLKSRATRNNRSFEGEVRHILAAAAKDDLAAKKQEFLARIAELSSVVDVRGQIPSEILIREDRDNGHR